MLEDFFLKLGIIALQQSLRCSYWKCVICFKPMVSLHLDGLYEYQNSTSSLRNKDLTHLGQLSGLWFSILLVFYRTYYGLLELMVAHEVIISIIVILRPKLGFSGAT